MAKYLAQYDPSGDPRLDIRDEAPWSKEEIKETQDSLVENGFYYPNGQKSVITWMDFDGDGICDFTASAGIGGMRSIDRMFLFHGLPNGKFQLVDSGLAYMDESISVVPYIPIKVVNEKFPILISLKSGRILQWQEDSRKLASCNPRQAKQRISSLSRKLSGESGAALKLLCPHFNEIVEWAEQQLPSKNAISHY